MSDRDQPPKEGLPRKDEEEKQGDEGAGSMNLALLRQQIAALEKQQQEFVTAQRDTPKDHKFWKTQPVPQGDADEEEKEGPFEPDRPIEEIKAEPYSLPAGFEWSTLDVDQPEQLDELYTLLNKNYVEDDDNLFRFDYSRDFLKWALQPPGWKRVWHCGIRNAKKKNLLAFISAIPANIRLRERVQPMVEINFLCVHKKLRTKRLAPVLIKEITRRVNREGLFQATYTAGMVIPRPIASCQYWHRSLNPQKLIDIKFSYQPRGVTMSRLIKKFKMPQQTTVPLVKMEDRHCEKAHKLLSGYLKKFPYAPEFTLDEFKHWLMPREGVIESFVLEDEESGDIKAFTSFYHLPSTVVNHPTHSTLNAVYSYYNVTADPKSLSMEDLMYNALILAKQLDSDVFNALDLMDNKEFLERLKFGPGDGHLRYYLYNYCLKPIEPNEVGLVLL